jgi:hypothetical protein
MDNEYWVIIFAALAGYFFNEAVRRLTDGEVLLGLLFMVVVAVEIWMAYRTLRRIRGDR